GGVAGEDGVWGDVRRDLPVEILLPVHALGDRLDYQVAAFQQLEPGVVVGGDDAGSQRLVGQRGRAQLGQVGDRLVDDAVWISLFCRQVEQHRVHAGIGQVRRDLRAHDAGTEYRGPSHK